MIFSNENTRNNDAKLRFFQCFTDALLRADEMNETNLNDESMESPLTKFKSSIGNDLHWRQCRHITSCRRGFRV